MADLLQSLIKRPHNSQSHSLHHVNSDESFHSAGSQPFAAATPHNTNEAAAPHQGLPILDLHSYLSDSSNAPPLFAPTRSRSPPKSSSQQSNGTMSTAYSVQPLPLGTKTSHHVSSLNLLCQARGLPTPIFDLNQQGQGHETSFGGVVRVGEATVGGDGRFRNKQEAKESLAQEAMGTVKEMTPRARKVQSTGGNASTGKNWIGMLQEYHDSTYRGAQSPIYHYFSLGSTFSATCTIPTYPDSTFGSQDVPFPTKKAAQANAAKQAVELLIAESKLNQDGSPLRKRRNNANILGTNEPLASQGLVIKASSTTYAQKVNEFAPLLGLSPAQYHLFPSSSPVSNLLSGFATFAQTNGIEELEGHLGEARNVFGRKNAREEIARGVWERVSGVAEKKGIPVRVEED